MDKIILDINSLLEYNNKSVNDFEGKEYLRCKCPNCPEGKSPALSIHKSLKFARCFRCGTLFINQGLHYEQLKDDLFSLEREDKNICGVGKFPDSSITMLFDNVPMEGNEYLRSRNPHVTNWTKYHLGYDDNSIFIPYYYMNKLIFYQVRYMSGARRYNMPSLPSPLYFPHEWDMTLPTIICEGPFDAIALDCAVGDKFNIVGLVGKELTNYKKRLLNNLSTPKYYIMLDEYELSKHLKEKNYNLRNAEIIYTDGPDPEELLNAMGRESFIEYIEERT